MNDQRFFDLAMKAVAQQATVAERTELDAALADDPARRAEFAQLQAQTRLAREVLPLAAAVKSTPSDLPAYARGRLQTKVRETLGRPPVKERSKGWGWRLFLVLTPAAAVIFGLLTVVLLKPAEPVIQVAVLDTAGTSRGADTKDRVLLSQQWKTAPVQRFEKSGDLQVWENARPAGPAGVKVVYDRSAGELRVVGRWKGKLFRKTFLAEKDLPETLRQAADFIREQTK